MADLKERYKACILLHATGDAMGYKNGSWEFNYNTKEIHKELSRLDGVAELKLNKENWRLSDDTILHLAIAEFLIEYHNEKISESTYRKLIEYYKKGMQDMKGRAPGQTTIDSVNRLNIDEKDGYKIPFNKRGGGCGVSMRSSCIGLRFPEPNEKEDLIAFSIESGRMTHHHPIGYLGGVVSALFTSYAIQGVEIKKWGKQFLEDSEIAKSYIEKSGYYVKENLDDWRTFIDPWKRYLKERDIENGTNEPKFPEKYGVEERDEFYKKISGLNNWPGGLGLDSVLIAYDALLGCKGDWIELCKRAMLHGGDNDSTGCIAGSWFGALYGFKGVPENNYKNLEYKDKLEKAGEEFFKIKNKAG